MSSAVEDEIVSMKFDNTQFKSAATESLSILDKLKNALKLPTSAVSGGLSDISKNVRGFNLNPLVDSASEVGKAFSAMSVVAISAIATLASQATTAAYGIVKSFSLDPIMGGFDEYNTQLGSIQTILSNTGLEGQKGLDRVNGALQDLNKYSDRTIYNFTEMARNIGTFTAAGVNLDTSTAAIKGIANLAAVSGSTSQQASTAMYQLSQALASGTVKLMDWNSVVNAGMGGKVFKDSLMETARVHGVAIDQMVKDEGSFRDTLQKGWLTSDILTETLQKFTGDLSAAQLKSMGYTQKQIEEIQKLGKMANDAATKVKTIPQLMGTLKEAVGSGWTRTMQLVFGDFNQARSTFTNLSNYLGDFVKANAKARNNVLKDWSKLHGRTVLIKAIKHAWEDLMSILGPIHDAFREIFPATTGKQLFELTQSINHFFKALVLSKDAQENLKRTFAGLFAVIHIGVSIVKGIVHVLGTLIGLFLRGQGGTLALTGSLGDMLVALDKFLTGGGRMEKFFNGLADVLVAILGPILDLRTALIETFLGLVTGDPTRMFAGINDAISTTLGFVDMLSDKVATTINAISDAFGGLGHVQGFDLAGMFGGAGGAGGAGAAAGAAAGIEAVKGSMSGLAGIIEKIHTAWSAFVDGLKGFGVSTLATAGDEASSKWNGFLNVLNAIGDFLRPLYSQFISVFGAIKDVIGNALSGKGIDFTDFLNAVNTGLFLAIFLTIRNFSTAISNVSKAAAGVLNQVTSNLKTMQNQVRAQIIFTIAASLVLLAGAVFLLSKTDPKQLGVALGAVVVMLGALVVAMKTLEKATDKLSGGAKLTLIAAGMVLMAVALAAMAGAVYLFSKIDPDNLAQGLIGVSASLALLTGAAVAMSKSGAGANMIGAATGLLIMSAALVALSGAILLYAQIDPETLTNGLVKVAAAIAVLALSMNLMKTGVGGAAAMVIVSGGLIILAGALKLFATMSGGDIFKSLATVGAALLILAGGLYLMQGALAGAAAVFIAAEALAILGPAIALFGQLSWETIGKGLLVIVGSMLALAGVAFVIAPVVPVLLALAAAIALIGATVFLIGSGVAAFATGLALLAHNGTAGMQALIDSINQFLDALPQMIDKFGAVIDAIARLIGEHAPQLNAAFGELMGGMLDTATKLLPRFGNFISQLIKTGLRVLVSYYSDLANAGLDLIMNLLDAMSRKIPAIVGLATQLGINFVRAMGQQSVRFANAALDALVDFLNGLANAIRSHQAELNAAGKNVSEAIVDGIKSFIASSAGPVRDAIISMIKSAASSAKDAAKGAVKAIIPGLRAGLDVPLTGSFAKLVGGTDQVKEALQSISSQIHDTLEKAKGDIDKWQNKLDQLKKNGGSPKQIEHAQKMLAAAKKLQDQAQDADKHYDKIMKKRGDDLRSLAKQYDEIQAAISAAQDEVDKAQAKVDNFKKNVMSTFAEIPAPQAGQSLASYMRELQKQTERVIKFKQMLAAAQALGLDPKQVEWFLSQGLDAQKILEQLVAGGPEAIAQFEAAQNGLEGAGQDMADTFADMLPGYNDALKTAKDILQGIIDGVGDKKSLKELEDAMGQIAKIMMKAIRKELQVKSPSRKMMEVGRFAVMGLTKGLDKMHSDVERSSAALGQTALDTLQATLSKTSTIGSDLSSSPVITPILDLTQLTKDANAISSLMTANPITAAVSFTQASDISANREAAAASTDDSSSGGFTEIKLEQNNYSPETLDDVTIYRSTKNLLSITKEALGI